MSEPQTVSETPTPEQRLAQLDALARIAADTMQEIDDWLGMNDSPWRSEAPFGLVFTDVVRLPEPVPAKGALGFWRVPPDVERQVLAEEQSAREADARAAGGAR